MSALYRSAVKSDTRMKLLTLIGLSTFLAGTSMNACAASEANTRSLPVAIGQPTLKHTLRYKKMYEEKPFPDAVIYYYDNGIYKILSQGEDHYGVYNLQGSFTDDTYVIRFVSLPSSDWGGKTAFHQLIFIASENLFVQDAIVDTGEAIARQYGNFRTEPNKVADPRPERWRDPD